jgi:hypothetical protein
MEMTGILSFQLLSHGSHVQKEWGDTAHSKLEEKLGRVIGSLEYFAKKERVERIENERRRQEQKIKNTLIQEQNDQKEADFNNFKILLSDSLRWEKAQALRGYTSHIEKLTTSENLKGWIGWAIEKADWYDPTISKTDKLLKPFSDFHESLLNNSKSLDRYNIDKL